MLLRRDGCEPVELTIRACFSRLRSGFDLATVIGDMGEWGWVRVPLQDGTEADICFLKPDPPAHQQEEPDNTWPLEATRKSGMGLPTRITDPGPPFDVEYVATVELYVPLQVTMRLQAHTSEAAKNLIWKILKQGHQVTGAHLEIEIDDKDLQEWQAEIDKIADLRDVAHDVKVIHIEPKYMMAEADAEA